MASTAVTRLYLREVAHANGVRISEDALEYYIKLPNKAVAKDMVTHAAKLMKALGKKTIGVMVAKVEMAHYTKSH